MRSWGRAVFAVIVLASLSGSAWANCVGDDWSRTPEMACCSHGHEQCPMHDAGASCCAPSVSQAPSQATIVKTVSITAPDFRVLQFAITSAVTTSAPTTSPSFDSSPPATRLRPPTYIVFSQLLV